MRYVLSVLMGACRAGKPRRTAATIVTNTHFRCSRMAAYMRLLNHPMRLPGCSSMTKALTATHEAAYAASGVAA